MEEVTGKLDLLRRNSIITSTEEEEKLERLEREPYQSEDEDFVDSSSTQEVQQ